MSQIVPLEAVPNQSLSIQLDDVRYVIRLRDINGLMAVDLSINEEVVVSGERVVAGSPLVPYPYLEGDGGNFFFITELDDVPYWESFGVNQALIYATASEVEALRGD